MTYTYNDQAVHEAVAGGKVIIRRPIGMSDKKWIKYAEGVVKALDNRAPCTPLERGESLHKAAKLMMVEAVNACLAESAPSMKLVDILARELKAWPDQYYQIFQDSGGNLHGSLSDGDLEDCDNEDLPFGPVSIAWDGSNAVVDRAEWQAAVDALKAPKVDIADGNVRLGVLIEMGYLKPVHLETPSYDFSAWPPERFDCGLLPSLCIQSFGRSKSYKPVEVKPKTDSQENTEFLEARVKLLEAELAERREEVKQPINLKLSDDDLLFLLRSQSGVSAINVPLGRSGVIVVRREGAEDQPKEPKD